MNTRTITSTLILAMLAMPVAYADTHTRHKLEKMHKDHTMMDKYESHVRMTDGVVEKLDMKRGMVTLKHDEVHGVMAAMTMGYRTANPEELEGLKVGDKVRFTMEKQGEEYVLTHIEMMK